MSESILNRLIKAEQLTFKENNTKALELVKAISKEENITEDEKLACILLESRIIYNQGKQEQALKLIENIWPKISKLGNLILILDYLSIKTNHFWTQGEMKKGIEFIEKHVELVEKLESKIKEENKVRIKYRKCAYLRNQGILYWYTGELEKALEIHTESLALADEINDKIAIINSYNNIGLVYWSKGAIDKTIEYYKQALKIAEELDSTHRIARVLTNLGNALTSKGNLDEALEMQLRSLEIKKKFGKKKDLAITTLNVGVIYQLKGELNQAMEFYEESLQLSEEIDDKSGIANALNNIGNIYDLKGDIDLANEKYMKSLKLYTELGIKEKIALLYLNIGTNASMKGNLDDALKYFNQSFKIYKELGNSMGSAIVLLELIQEAIEKKDQELALEYLEQLQQINKSVNIRSIDQRCRLAQAISLKYSDHVRNRTKAIVILEQIIEEEIIDHSLTVKAMIHLAELLITELKQTADEELLKEIKELVFNLHQIAEEQESNTILVELYRLEAMLALAELDLKGARELLEKGLEFAQEKGLERFTKTIQEEQNKLEEHIKLWEDLRNRNASLKETLQHIKIEESMKKVQYEETVTNRKLFILKL